MRAFSLSFFFSVVFAALPFSAYADDDSDYIDFVASANAIDPTDLRLMVSALQATSSASGNITNDVAAILNLLQSISYEKYGLVRINTQPTPLRNTNYSLGEYMNRLFTSVSGDSMPAANATYLYQIRQLLQNAIYTNDLSNVESSLDTISLDLNYLYRLYDYFYGLTWLGDLQTTLENNQTNWWDEFRYDDGLWNSHLDDSQWEALLDHIDAISTAVGNMDSPFDDSSWQGFADDFGDVSDDIADILYYVQHIDQDIHDEMIADSEEISQASSETSQIVYEEESGQDAFEDQLEDDTSDAEDLLADNEPDYEVHYTDNPMEPLTNAVNFRAKMERHLPNLDSLDTTAKTRVFLFKTEWDPEGLLTRSGSGSRSGNRWNGLENVYFDLSGSDPNVPNQLLNYASTAMAWAWNLSACLLAFMMLKQFWDWVASWRA